MNLHQVTGHDLHKPRKLHNRVEAQIKQYVKEHNLDTGTQLPTEAEFCTLFKVSRSTVRHALQRLENEGLINRTRGRGTFLIDPAQANRETLAEPAADRGARNRNVIGVVLSYASEIDVMQTAILRGVEHAVKSRGCNLIAGRTDDWDEAGEARVIADLYRLGVGGFIILPIANRTTTCGVRSLVEQKTPVLLVDRYLSDLDTNYVVSDNFAGSYSATEHLILLGYRSFAYLLDQAEGPAGEMLLTTSIRDRYAGYCQALRDYQLAEMVRPPYPVDHTSKEAVRRMVADLRADSAAVPALVAQNDHLATEVINTGAKVGLRPPDDYAIVGFDDLPFASRLLVPLTTVSQQRYEIGFRAGHLLMDKIAGHAVRTEKVSLLVSLIVRESCGAHRRVQATAAYS